MKRALETMIRYHLYCVIGHLDVGNVRLLWLDWDFGREKKVEKGLAHHNKEIPRVTIYNNIQLNGPC